MFKSPYTFILAVFFTTNVLADGAPSAVMKILPELQALGKNPVIIQAVKKQNGLRLTMATIKTQDKQWIANSGLSKSMIALLNNNAAKELKKLEDQTPTIAESFVMDNQGANVAMTNKTSDYWQGDEAKFKKSYQQGKGAVHIGKAKFDESSQAYLVQVSVPVLDRNKAIGAITFGLNID